MRRAGWTLVAALLLATSLDAAAQEEQAGTEATPTRAWWATVPPRQSLPLAPPASSPIAEVERDCGFSAAFRDGVALWIFCDSLLYEGSALVDFVNNSAALATPDAPLVMRDNLDSAGNLVQLIEPVPGYAPCPAGEHHFIWPTAATVVPDGAIDRALIYFVNLCGPTGGVFPDAVSIGLAELRYTPGTPLRRLHAPLRATVLNPSLFTVGSSASLIFGEQAVYYYGYVYVYRCGVLPPRYGCQVARAPAASAASRAAYRFYVDGAWQTDPSDLTGWLIDYADYPLGGGQVYWMPRQQVFAMVWVDEAYGWNELQVQTSPTPMGPWNIDLEIPLTEDCDTLTSRCYAGSIHPHLGTSDELVFTYMDTVHAFASGRSPRGQLRALSQPIQPSIAWWEGPRLPHSPCWPWFLDVADPNVFCGAIAWASANGVVAGFEDGTYRPTVAVSRQGIASMLWRLAGSPAGPFTDPGYTDVPATHPFFTPIAWISDAGLLAGYADGTFGPSRPVSRAAAAAVLWRAAGSPAGPFPDPGYTDVPATHPFFTPIAWITDAGLASGYGDGTFGAAAPMTRQAAAALLQAAVDAGLLGP